MTFRKSMTDCTLSRSLSNLEVFFDLLPNVTLANKSLTKQSTEQYPLSGT